MIVCLSQHKDGYTIDKEKRTVPRHFQNGLGRSVGSKCRSAFMDAR